MAGKFNFLCIAAICYVKCVAAGQSSLTFVIDHTFSMRNDLAHVKSGASAIFDTVMFHKDESQVDNFVLVTFNDRSDSEYQPDVRLRAKTKDRDEFMSALSGITVSGGAYSCAELPLAGIKRGLEESHPKSSIYVFTDATTKDYDAFEEVKRIAQEKQCQIVFVLTGICERYIRQPLKSPGYQVFHKLAQATNGQVFHLYKYEIWKVLEYVKATITGRRTVLTKTKLSPGLHNITIDTDALMGELLLSFASVLSNSPSVNIEAPDGTDVLTKLLLETLYAKVYSANVTKTGQHTVHVNSPRAATTAMVTAKTGVDFQHGFSTFIPSTIDDTSTRPAPGIKSYLSIKLTTGNIDLRSIKILDMDKNELQDLPLAVTNKEDKFYTTEAFDPPTTDFIITVNGFDPVSRTIIIRQASTPVEVQKTLPGETITNKAPSVVIEGENTIKATFGEPLQLVCKVEGYPKPNIVWKNKATGLILSNKVSPGKNYQYDYISVLTLGSPTEDATYICEAKTRFNSDSKEITVQVTRNRFLKIKNGFTNIVMECEKDAKIFCAVEAYPPAVITWYKDDVQLKADEHIKISTDLYNNSVVTIKGAMPSDSGKYTCEAENEYVKQTVDNLIVVGQENVVIDKSVSNVTVTKGQPTTIQCKILKGKPKPSIRWTLETPLNYIFNVDNWKDKESNVISSVKENDAGKYRCHATNVFSQDSHAVHLIVN